MKLNPDFSPLEELAKKMGAKKSDWRMNDWALRFDGSEWSYLDEKRLVNLFQTTDESIEEISQTLGRSVASVEAKLKNKYGPGVLKKYKK